MYNNTTGSILQGLVEGPAWCYQTHRKRSKCEHLPWFSYVLSHSLLAFLDQTKITYTSTYSFITRQQYMLRLMFIICFRKPLMSNSNSPTHHDDWTIQVSPTGHQPPQNGKRRRRKTKPCRFQGLNSASKRLVLTSTIRCWNEDQLYQIC